MIIGGVFLESYALCPAEMCFFSTNRAFQELFLSGYLVVPSVGTTLCAQTDKRNITHRAVESSCLPKQGLNFKALGQEQMKHTLFSQIQNCRI
jgi:hypothetical protein